MQRHIQPAQLEYMNQTTGETERRQAISRLRQLIDHGDRSGRLTGAGAKKLAAAVAAELGQTEWVG